MMKSTTRLLITVLVLAVGGILSAGAIQQETASGLFEKAVYLEETKGDLQQAIEIYGRIIERFADNQPVAAKALYRMGLCHEKMGSQEAQKAYRSLIDRYPGQKEEVALARARLAELSAGVLSAARKPSFRQMRIPTRITPYMNFSPDGGKIAYSAPPECRLWTMSSTSKLGPEFPGEPVALDTGELAVEYSGHAWSGDGKWIAFTATGGEEVQKRGYPGIYIIPSQGGKPRKIHEDRRGLRFVNYRMSLSPDGKILAFSAIDGEKKEQHIFTMPVDGEGPKLLAEMQAREPVFSPDGRMIAFVEDSELGARGGSLYVVSAKGSPPKLAAKAGMATSPVWSPGSDMIAYIDWRDKAARIHVVPVGKDGKAEPTAIDAPQGFQGIEYLAGWTPDNTIGAVFNPPREFGLYAVGAEGGQAAVVSHGGNPLHPRFSPDGKRIFHFNTSGDPKGGWGGPQNLGLAVVSVEGGPVKVLPLDTDDEMILADICRGNAVSPDGKTLAFSARTAKDSGPGFHVWTLSAEGGRPRRITDAPGPATDISPCWSPDGKRIAFIRSVVSERYEDVLKAAKIWVVDVTGGEPGPLTSESDAVYPGSISWSPDGQVIAYFSRFPDSVDGTLNTIPLNGGPSRVVGKAPYIYADYKELAWSPDSRRIAFNSHQRPARRDSTIKVMSIEDGSVTDIATGLVDAMIYHLDWSRDGKKLVFACTTGGGREFWLMENFLHLVKK
jgi:Tol biopolymer transport system component